MINARLIHLSFEEVALPDYKPDYTVYRQKGQLSVDFDVDAFAQSPLQFERKVLRGMRMRDENGDVQWFYFDLEQFKEAMPIINGIINSQIEQVRQEKFEIAQMYDHLQQRFVRLADKWYIRFGLFVEEYWKSVVHQFVNTGKTVNNPL